MIYIGLDNVAGYFETSVVAMLEQNGLALDSYDMAHPVELVDQISAGAVELIDVRGKGEWDESHIPGARHFMLGYLCNQAEEVINGKPIVVQCQSSARGAIGASILKKKGAREVINMVGGITAWQNAGLPVEG